MRNLFFSVAILGALIWAMASAEGAIIALNWICFQRPQDFSDWWAGAPIFQIALAIAIVSNVVRGKFRPRVPGLLVVYYCLIVWIILSAAFAFDTDHAWDFCKMYLPSMIVIHGVGSGKLRDEIHEILRAKRKVKSFVNRYDPRYGYGATEIFFQY